MFLDDISNASSVQIKAKKIVAGGSVEGLHNEGDYLIYSVLIENSFYNEKDELVIEFEGDIIAYNEKNPSFHSGCTRLFPLTFSLEGVTDEHDFSVKILKYMEAIYYSQMQRGIFQKELSKLLWLDSEKLAALGCNDERMVTTNVEIEFKNCH